MSPHALEPLEPDQLSASRQTPYPRRKLSRGTKTLLWALRLYVLIAVPLVAYAFMRAVRH